MEQPIRIKENQSKFRRIRWNEIARTQTKIEHGYFMIYRDLAEEEQSLYPDMLVITDQIKTAPSLTFGDFETIRSILASKSHIKVSGYHKIKCTTNYVVADSLLIYIQIIINGLSLSIIFNPTNRFTSFEQYNSINDDEEGHIYIENDMHGECYNAPEYYEGVDKRTIIHDHVKWLEECFEKFQSE
jgi:hypothetical protein